MNAQPSTSDGGPVRSTQVGGAAEAGRARRRPYQQRRKERSCDHCKTRKTKCDAKDNEACTACKVAKLDCKFSSTEHEGRKLGPAKRIRQLERMVDDLSQRIRELEGGSYAGGFQSMSGGTSQNDPMSSSSLPESPVVPGKGTSENSEMHNVRSTMPSFEAVTGPPTDAHGQVLVPQKPKPEPFEHEKTSWNPNAFGPGSAPHLIDSYKEFIHRYGSHQEPSADHVSATARSGNIYQAAPMVPLLSDFIASNVTYPVDLKGYLPPREQCQIVIEVFRRTIQTYKVPFYWPFIEQKLWRAWQGPLLDNDPEAVAGVFCVVMMVLAVGSQLLDKEELAEDVRPLFVEKTQERNGWKFFELARKYMNLNNPVYTLEDATVFVLMSLYLDKASLPSPCWWVSGAMGRVCQDIGLHRKPPSNRYTPEELEARIRLFWLAYVQDKRVAMKMGRPFILREEDCDIPLPGTYEFTGIVAEKASTDQGGGHVTFMREDPACPELDHKKFSRKALQTCGAIIEACKVSEAISDMRLSKDNEENIAGAQKLDQRLEAAWNKLPEDFRDYNRDEVMDLPATRALFIVQHARLNIFRYFTDFAPRRSISDSFRSFCLQQSIRVSKISAAILNRAQKHPEFDRLFGVRTDDLVHLHTFRVAIILLLGSQMRNNTGTPFSVDEGDIETCVLTLQAIARVHVTGRKFLGLYKEFAKYFNHPSSNAAMPESFNNNGHKIQMNQPQQEVAPQIAPIEWQKSDDVSWNGETTQAPVEDQQMMGTAGGNMPMTYTAAEIAESTVWSAPEILSQIDQGDFSDFQNMLSWDMDFMESFSGDQSWPHPNME